MELPHQRNEPVRGVIDRRVPRRVEVIRVREPIRRGRRVRESEARQAQHLAPPERVHGHHVTVRDGVPLFTRVVHHLGDVLHVPAVAQVEAGIGREPVPSRADPVLQRQLQRTSGERH